MTKMQADIFPRNTVMASTNSGWLPLSVMYTNTPLLDQSAVSTHQSSTTMPTASTTNAGGQKVTLESLLQSFEIDDEVISLINILKRCQVVNKRMRILPECGTVNSTREKVCVRD